MTVLHHGTRLTTVGTDVFSVRVVRSCGHAYVSSTGWNTERAAIDHGRDLVDLCVCGVCRRRHVSTQREAA